MKQLLLGDEAIALGAIDAGLSGVYAYPGTPSTEITEFIQAHPLTKDRHIHCHWSCNEKTAMEAALGMSYSGKRALVCMKMVGMNVCADPFVNSAITGVNGGLVVLVADDPSMHSSSGTTGTPTVILHTRHDLDVWADLVARSLWMVGARPEDVFQNTSGYGMFTGGLGFQYGAERLGMLTVPAAAGNTKRQIKFMRDFGTTVVHIIPSYATRVREVMDQEGVDPRRDTRLRILAIGAEPHSNEQRMRIERMLGVKAYNSFGMSEMQGPGVGFECDACRQSEENGGVGGFHIWEDCYIVEIVDPVTLEPVPDGEMGELVMTSINREAMPLLRYRTRDLTRKIPGVCPCGRTHVRVDRLRGRSDDMIVLKGVNIFPIQVEKILMQFPELGNNYLITLVTREDNDFMNLDVELAQPTDDYAALQTLEREIKRRLKDEILLTPNIRLVPQGTLPVSEGKAVRVVDKRRVYQ